MRNELCVNVSSRSVESDQRRRALLLLLIFVALRAVFSASGPAAAQVCDSLPVAVNDEAFHEGDVMVIDVLANDVEPDGEALTVNSVSMSATAPCSGTLSEDLGLVSLDPAAPFSEECQIDYQVVDEQGNTAMATVFVHSTGLLFKDGFESGDTSAWDEEVR